jgi:hypothetical protein
MPFPAFSLSPSKPLRRTKSKGLPRAAQYQLDSSLHELHSGFVARENKLRDDCFAEGAEITAASAA